VVACVDAERQCGKVGRWRIRGHVTWWFSGYLQPRSCATQFE
jgi:hypothetical protein